MGCWSIVIEGEEEPAQKEKEEATTTKIGSTSTDPATAGHLCSSWKRLTSNGCPSLQPIRRPPEYGRPSRTNSPVRIQSLFTHNSHPFSDCELRSSPTLHPPSPNLTQWIRLQTRCSTARATDQFTLPSVFQTVFESAEAKAAFLLNTLPSSMSNIKDNLMIKDNLTYEQCYQHHHRSGR